MNIQHRAFLLALILMVLKNALVIGPIIKELAEEASTSDANLEVGDRIVEDVENSTENTRDMMPSKINGSHGKDVALRIQNNPSLLATTNEKPPVSFSNMVKKMSGLFLKNVPEQDQRKIEEVKRHHLELSKKVKELTNEFDKKKSRFPEDGKQFETHIFDWKICAGNLYATKVNQLKKGRLTRYVRPDLLPDVLWDQVYTKYANNFFSSFASVVQTGVHYGEPENVDQKAILLMESWSDLMLDFYLDLTELEILPKPRSENFEGGYAGQFVLSYILGKYYPFDYASTFINLNLRECILKDFNNQRIKDIAQEFHDATWRQMEFQFLEARLKQVEDEVYSKDFYPLMTELLKRGFHTGGNLEFNIGRLLEDIIPQPHKLIEFDLKSSEKIQIKYKLVYDILIFIKQYNPELFSFILENGLNLQEFERLENIVLLASSLSKP